MVLFSKDHHALSFMSGEELEFTTFVKGVSGEELGQDKRRPAAKEN